MNELLRLDYLDAMGITQYVARLPLPGARPSSVIHVEAEQAVSVTALFDEVDFSVSKKPVPQVVRQPAATASPSSPLSAASIPATFQCQIAIWTVDDLLILADAPRIDNNQITLLRNILLATGRTGSLSDVRQFSWPLAQRKEKHLSAARDHFQGLLDGGLLKNPGLRQILCFGENVLPLLVTDGAVDSVADNPGSISLQQYQDWPILTTCNLQNMIEQPERKAHTWRVLQVLVRA